MSIDLLALIAMAIVAVASDLQFVAVAIIVLIIVRAIIALLIAGEAKQ